MNNKKLSFKTKAFRYQKWYRGEYFKNSINEKDAFLNDDAGAGKIFYHKIQWIFEGAKYCFKI